MKKQFTLLLVCVLLIFSFIPSYASIPQGVKYHYKLRLESIIDLYHPKYSRFEERILDFKKQMHPELE